MVHQEGAEVKKHMKFDPAYFAPMNFTEHQVKFNERYWAVTFDENYIYIHQDGKGIKKLVKTEGQSAKVGYTIQENPDLFQSA